MKYEGRVLLTVLGTRLLENMTPEEREQLRSVGASLHCIKAHMFIPRTMCGHHRPQRLSKHGEISASALEQQLCWSHGDVDREFSTEKM